jgi:hypothetical protein
VACINVYVFVERGIATKLLTGWSRFRIAVRAKMSRPVLGPIQTCSSGWRGSVTGVKRPERDVDHSLSSSAEFNNNLTFRGPCIVIYSFNESQPDALFLKFI